MKKRFLLVCIALLSLFNVSATVTPITSTAGSDVWYHLKFRSRNTPTAVWLTGSAAGGMVALRDFTNSNDQLWKVVTSGSGIALVNKQFGSFMGTDVLTGIGCPSVATAPAMSLQIVPSNNYPGCVFLVDSKVVVAPGSNNCTGSEFTLYAVGVAYDFVVGNITNYNSAPLEWSTVIFMSDKELLSDIIATANATLAISSEGTQIGQFAAQDISALQATITDAQASYDSPTSTASEISTQITSLSTIYALFKSYVIMPEISTGAVDSWYYLKGELPANTTLTAPATGTFTAVKNAAIIPNDTQLWKLVPNGSGFALQNKATGEYIGTDVAQGNTNNSPVLNMQASMPAKALRFLLSHKSTDKIFRLFIENTDATPGVERLRFNSPDADLKSYVGNYTSAGCTYSFVDFAVAQRGFLKDKLAVFNTIAATTQSGTNPGQVTLAGMNEFKAAIAAAQAVYDNLDLSSDDYIAASLSLENAKPVLKTKVSLPIISTDASSTYYTLSGTRPAVTSVIYNNANDTIKYQVMKNEDAELWRFVANGTGIAIQNKATSKYLACDSANYTDSKTQTAMPVRPLKFVITDEIAAGAYRFIIENDTNVVGAAATFRLHAGGTVPMNYADDAADNCGWLIADNSQAIKNAYNAIITAAEVLYPKTATYEGSSFGKYPASARSAFNTILTNAKAADLNAMTIVQLQTAYANLSTNWTTFKNSRVSDITTLVSTAAAPKWFFINNDGASDKYSYNKRMSKQEGSVYGVNKDNAKTDQMWRFELNPIAGENTVMMVNKTANEELVFVGTSTVCTLGTGGSFFVLGVHDNGLSTIFSISAAGDELHLAGGMDVVGWNDNNSFASGWSFEQVSGSDAVKEVTVTKLNIHSNNGIITVDGVDNFDVYSVMGQRMNAKAVLNKGIYIVKANRVTQKYIVR